MALEALTQYLGIWVSQYLAIFCLATIAIWALVTYLCSDKWERPVRDAGIQFLVIGTLTLLLALRPEKGDYLFWKPLTWFCFSMLIIMELLWIVFLIESLFQGIVSLSGKIATSASAEEQRYRTGSFLP